MRIETLVYFCTWLALRCNRAAVEGASAAHTRSLYGWACHDGSLPNVSGPTISGMCRMQCSRTCILYRLACVMPAPPELSHRAYSRHGRRAGWTRPGPASSHTVPPSTQLGIDRPKRGEVGIDPIRCGLTLTLTFTFIFTFKHQLPQAACPSPPSPGPGPTARRIHCSKPCLHHPCP